MLRNWNVSTLEDIWYNVKISDELYVNSNLETTNRADEAEGFSEWSDAHNVSQRYEQLTGIHTNIVAVDLSLWL